jgi:hypothetical protein
MPSGPQCMTLFVGARFDGVVRSPAADEGAVATGEERSSNVAEHVMIVCDVCGAPAIASVIVGVHGGGARDGQKYSKDLCDTHLSELISNARKPRRGRRRARVTGAPATPARKPRPRRMAASRSSASAAPAAAPRRRGRPPKSASADAAPAAPAAPRRRGRPRKAAPGTATTGASAS